MHKDLVTSMACSCKGRRCQSEEVLKCMYTRKDVVSAYGDLIMHSCEYESSFSRDVFRRESIEPVLSDTIRMRLLKMASGVEYRIA